MFFLIISVQSFLEVLRKKLWRDVKQRKLR